MKHSSHDRASCVFNTADLMEGITANRSANNVSYATPQESPQMPASMNEEEKIGITVGYILIFLVAIVGNSLVIYLIRSLRDMRRIPFNYFMVNMAAADIISTIFTVPISINFIFYGIRWLPGVVGIALCRFTNFGLHISIATSIFTLTLMAVDRYRLIVLSTNKSLSFQSVKVSVVIIWICAAAVFAPELYKYTVVYDPQQGYICVIDWYAPALNLFGTWSLQSEKAALVIKFILCYGLPLPVLFIVYFLIMWHLFQRKNQRQFSNDKQLMNKITVQNRKVIQMLIVVLTAFAVCWLPVYIVHFLDIFDMTSSLKMGILRQLCFFMAHANSAINPCIYLSFIQKFRGAIQRRYTSKIKNRLGSTLRASEFRQLTKSEGFTSPPLHKRNCSQTFAGSTKCTEESNESDDLGLETKV